MKVRVFQVLVLCVVLPACGRLNFDPWSEAGDAATGDGTAGDGGDGGGMGIDAPSGACLDDLSNVGLNDFSIVFAVTTTSASAMSVLYQRAACDSTAYWQVTMGAGGLAGRPVFELVAAGSSGSSPTSVAVNDGAPHVVEFRRIAGVFSGIVDGGAPNSQTLPLSMTAYPPLGVVAGHPCGLAPLVGTIAGICVKPL